MPPAFSSDQKAVQHIKDQSSTRSCASPTLAHLHRVHQSKLAKLRLVHAARQQVPFVEDKVTLPAVSTPVADRDLHTKGGKT